MKNFYFFFLLCFTYSLSFSLDSQRISSPTEFVKQPFDVIHYDLTLDLTAAPKAEMNGLCKIKLNWSENPDTCKFYFHLRGLEVDSVFYENVRVNAVAVEDESSATFHYEIAPPVGLGKDSIIISIYYSGLATAELGSGDWGGVQSTSTSLYALGVGFMNNYVSATQHWMPCYDHPSDKATFSGNFIVKNEHSVASIGELLSIEDKGENRVFKWVHNIPCATYLYTFAVDSYCPIEIEGASVPIIIYSLAKDTIACGSVFRKVPDMLDAFSSRFGDYPFEKVGYVLTSKGSMEHQTMISYAESLAWTGYNSNDSLNLTAAHELAHQWFGNYVTCLDFRDAWLNEGFATFCEAIWYEHLFGYNKYLEHISSKIREYLRNVRFEGALPLYDFPRESPSSNYPNTIYSKGAAVVAMLRYELGDSLFFLASQEYLNSLAFGNATTELLQKIFEKVAGKNLSWFFDQWAYGLGYPMIYVTAEKVFKENGLIDVQINIKQEQPKSYGAYMNLPIEMTFIRGAEKTDQTIVLDDIEQNFVFEDIPDFSSIVFNSGSNVRSLFELRNLIITEVPSFSENPEEIAIYPNPANSVINIKLNSTTNPNISISLHNELGDLVYSFKTEEASSSNFIHQINAKELNKGVYFIKIHNGAKVFTEKLILL
ncbi:MAG: T9SS type A sorting domain-containing protein [Ignavibacteria bacterium]|nr:T9SS type A sorting domain-containing protein [Ignavibacteria bacterium]